MGAPVAEVRSPLVGMYFLLRRVLAFAKNGYNYTVQGGFAPVRKSSRRERNFAL